MAIVVSRTAGVAAALAVWAVAASATPVQIGPLYRGGPADTLTVGGTPLSTIVPTLSTSGATIRLVASGTSDTSTDAINTTIKWTSTVTANKTQSIPTCGTGNKALVLIVKDGAGTAATYSITVTPVSGTIDGAASLVMNTTRASRTLQCDGASDWTVE